MLSIYVRFQLQQLNDHIEYKKRCAIANKTFKTKRREHYKAFARSLDITTNPKYVWITCKILKNKWVTIKQKKQLT